MAHTIYSMKKELKIRKLIHGRETYAVYYGDGYVLKRPMPTFGEEACDAWLAKQHKTKEAIDAIRAVGNPAYNVPAMHYINDDEYQILEERAPGYPLTPDLFRYVSRRQRYEIINSLASFLVDMNELKPIGEAKNHRAVEELKFNRLDNFISNKMSNWFSKNEVLYMSGVRDKIANIEYPAQDVWSHNDLNPGNVFYDPKTSRLSFIDFAEAGYRFIYRDLFSPLQQDLDITKAVYEGYTHLHNKGAFPLLSIRNEKLREIMKARITVILLRRFIKAADSLRVNPDTQKAQNANADNIAFIRDLMRSMQNTEHLFHR